MNAHPSSLSDREQTDTDGVAIPRGVNSMSNHRVTTDLRGHTVVEANLPCINGLSAWVMVADLGKPYPEDEMFGGLDRDAIGKRIVAALDTASPLSDEQIDALYLSKLAGKSFDNIAVAFRAMVRAVERAHGIGSATSTDSKP